MDSPFPPPVLQRYREFLEHFPGTRVIKSDTEAIVQCPDPDNRHSHGDRDPSLGVDLRVNGHGPEILLHCRSQECKRKKILRAVGLSDRDRFLEEGVDTGALPGCTLEEYAAYKNLPVEFLAGDTVGLEDSTRWCPVTRREVNAVLIPYFDEEGNEIDNCARYRTGLRKTKPDTRIRGIPKSKGGDLTLYGRHGLDDAREAGFVLMVEGESDAHVAWYYGKPAVGVPGAQNWRDEWGALLDGIRRIYVVVEDAAGEKLWAAVSSCRVLEGRVRRVVP